MKYFLITLVTTICFYTTYAQKIKTSYGPFFEEFGSVYTVNDADLLLESDRKYKVIFDVYTDGDDPKKMNPLINTVARFMNMHGQNAVSIENMEIVLILHGAAVKNALSQKVYQKEFKKINPNTDLIAALAKKNVKIFICGQSMLHKGYDKKDLSENVRISLSALTALVKYQSEGYQLINFN